LVTGFDSTLVATAGRVAKGEFDTLLGAEPPLPPLPPPPLDSGSTGKMVTEMASP
jgi:hypothetical protein